MVFATSPLAGLLQSAPGPPGAAATVGAKRDVRHPRAFGAVSTLTLSPNPSPPPQGGRNQPHQQQQQQQLGGGLVVVGGDTGGGGGGVLTDFSLLATFRLPGPGAVSGGSGGGGDVGDPELTLQLPLWSPHMCLAEYVPLAVERLQAQLDTHCSVLAVRHQLMTQLGELLGGLLELNLRGGVALYGIAWEGNPVLVSLELGSSFPSEKPLVVLQCVRVLPGADSSRSYREYPWSPRWSAGEMSARIHNWLQDELPVFLRGRAAQPP
ncbi:hypothetical protein VOLCADRAFT_98999 [Volvox carteri f. nagariensis]|uniref:BRISC and BRCA1-A complex member 2 n=1 Tax=Volvox carteri f. nagariensis TaxID=3068 RepID=D8UGS9_VOLCA|nr:uncharacterized protein VOLCADRAFT_98999 [Volvox carteri f. nagariensis]EFJ41080.1 hypothetical protein VOLCADRAFT_98999 [Volvox carteri f. nagariensis]|eukprot:XP_002957843.1 hypothetical protein VOLCADRAFT_98999 [Volvox carteri f. nagariensis]